MSGRFISFYSRTWRVCGLIFLALFSSTVYSATSLTFTDPPTVIAGDGTHIGSVGTTSLWSNVGTLNGTVLDMEIEIISNDEYVSGADSTLQQATSTVEFRTNGGEAEIWLRGADAVGQTVVADYKFFVSGTNTPITVIPESVFKDIDSDSGGAPREVMRITKQQVAAYTLEGPDPANTNIVVTTLDNGTPADDTDDVLEFISTVSGGTADTNIAFAVDFQPTSSLRLVFEKVSGGGRRFSYDSNVALFNSPATNKLDNTPPAVPTVNALSTNDPTPTLTGTAEEFTTITVAVGGATYEVVAEGGNNWVLDTGTVTPTSGSLNLNLTGANEVVVTSTDAAGNAAVDETINELTIDAVAPVVTIVEPSAVSNTSQANLSVTGTCTAGDGDVTVSIAGATPASQAVICSDGAWSATGFDVSALADGVDVVDINASQTDAAGNIGNATLVEIDKDTAVPSLTAVNVGPTSNRQPEFGGTTDQAPGALVHVKGPAGGDICSATVVSGAPSNIWFCSPSTPLSMGTSTYTAETSGQSGNRISVPFSVAIVLDADNDGIPDPVEGAGDADGDGIPNASDPDSDNDGILDVDENVPAVPLTGQDSDNDGIDDAIDVDNTGGTDANGNGVDDNMEPSDLDGDGVPDYLDTDADGDGIADIVEGDGDADNDGIPNYKDTDSDNDGIPDNLEDGRTVTPTGEDSDADGIDDVMDADITGGSDQNLNGVDDAFEPVNSDNTDQPDYLDPDSDNDGIPDAVESDNLPPLTNNDADGDGIDDALDVDQTGGVDANNDGIDDGLMPNDTDRDGIADYLDLDTDNDGIADSTEGGASGMDTDLDGIDDAYDVDQLGGSDADQDGVADDKSAPDFDLDSIPNFRDLDSDNDGLTDVSEAGAVDENGDGLVDDGSVTTEPRDSDLDTAPDYTDLDSDGDGTNDIANSDAAALDQDGDGQIDGENTADADGDGLPDVIDNAPNSFGTNADLDNDGVGNFLDIDDDNDGILDSLETDSEGNDIDTDGDGIVDRLDLDSDNDSIPDSIEARGNLQIDTNLNGIVDDLVDEDGNGLADVITDFETVVDTDEDGIPDFQDRDSDGDGIYDLKESNPANSGQLDGNNDGVIDSVTDIDGDGLKDSVDTSIENGTAANATAPVDTDGDGTPDIRDLDSDDDGIPDALENGDYDGDGQADHTQNDSGLRTAVTGTGGGSSSMLFIAIMLLGAIMRNKRKLFSGMCAVLLVGNLSLISLSSMATEGEKVFCNYLDADNTEYSPCAYGSLGIGITDVDPEGEANGWRTSDSSSQGYKITAGYQFKPKWFAELSYTDAGAAKLDNVNPNITGNPELDYKIPALMLGYYLREPNHKLNFFVKAGLSVIENDVNDSRVPFDQESSEQFALGVGAQWRFADRFFSRIELDSYDRDALYAGISLGMYIGGKAKSSSKPKPTPVQTFAEPKEPEPAPEPAFVEDISAEKICEEFSGAIEGIQFKTNSADLADGVKTILDAAAGELIKFSDVQVEIQAHTDSMGAESYNQQLSDQRALSVRDYLISQGVTENRLTAKGFGETSPRDTNETSEGRARNRRVEFKMLNQAVCE